jgi:diketogulonate reductase-like aldo/keto reductase
MDSPDYQKKYRKYKSRYLALLRQSGAGPLGSMPGLCFGTVQPLLEENLRAALEMGYRHLDGADSYLEQVGRDYYDILRKGLRASGIEREDLWITWKSGRVSIENVRRTIDKLDCRYLDLYLIHFGCGTDQDFSALQECQRAGLIRYFGVSNCEDIATLKRLKGRFDIYANQIQARPPGGRIRGRSQMSADFVEQCNEIGIRIMLFGSFSAVFNSETRIDGTMVSAHSLAGRINSYYLQRYVLGRGNCLMVSSITGHSLKPNLEAYQRVQGGASLLSDEEMAETETFLQKIDLDYM